MMNGTRWRRVAARMAALALCSASVSYARDGGSFPERLINPTSSPLTKIQLIARGAENRPLFLVPQTTGFILEGGYVVTVAHAFPSNLIARMRQRGDVTAYIKFPMFEKNFFNVDANRFTNDVIYIDESQTPFRNHTYFVKLTPVAQNPEQDHTLWTFNKDLARQLPSLKLFSGKTLPMDGSYYMLQSANPANSTGYLLNRLALNGIMFQHLPQDVQAEYTPVNGRLVDGESSPDKAIGRPAEDGTTPLGLSSANSSIKTTASVCMLGKRYLFDGYFKFGSSGAPVLNDRFEVVGVQSEALFTQYKYNDIAPNGQVFENQGTIFNRCAAVPADAIAATIETIETPKKTR